MSSNIAIIFILSQITPISCKISCFILLNGRFKNFSSFNSTPNNILYPACGESILGSNFDGCHVQKVDSTDQKWYIVPLCDACNHRTDEPNVNVTLVSVADNNK